MEQLPYSTLVPGEVALYLHITQFVSFLFASTENRRSRSFSSIDMSPNMDCKFIIVAHTLLTYALEIGLGQFRTLENIALIIL